MGRAGSRKSEVGGHSSVTATRSAGTLPRHPDTHGPITPSAHDPITLREIESLDRDKFVARFGFLFEGSPWIVDEAWASRPWGSRERLHAALMDVVRRAGKERQVALIQAHPDLVGRAALAGTLSRESTAEQRAAGLDPDALTEEEIARFQQANAAYRERFGFPFVICARENRKERILAGLAARLHNDRDTEIATALHEIGRIAWHRLADVVGDDEAARWQDGKTARRPDGK